MRAPLVPSIKLAGNRSAKGSRWFAICPLAVTSVAVIALNAVAVDFQRDIQPLLADRCFACHGPDANERKAELRLDLESGAKKAAVVPGQPDASELLQRISSPDPEKKMPPPDSEKKPLTPAQIELFRAWIAEGAKWTGHWAFTVPKAAEVPAVVQAQWPRNDLDRFVLAPMEAAGLAPSPEADRETLIRRLYFDLTGLPPSLDAVDAFVADDSADAYETLVDQLFASPAYGEQMARAWLDGARYGDTNGFQNDFHRVMWPWRDWIIDAYNKNMPYDEFAVKQIAGDLLPNATESDRVATGFNRNNTSVTEGGALEAEWHVENVIDRVNTTATVFLGLTMGCARCHDHKYDPITQKDFYSFFAFFNSTEELGYYDEAKGNVGPQVMLPSYEQQKKLSQLDAALTLAQQDLEDEKAKAGTDYDAWIQSLRAMETSPQSPKPIFEAPLNGALPSTSIATTPAWIVSVLGQALALDGKTDPTELLAGAVTLERGKPFSVALWARPDTPGVLAGRLIPGLMVSIGNKGAVEVRIGDAPDGLSVKTVDMVALKTWIHLGITYDGSGKTEGVGVYVDGSPIAGAASSAVPEDSTNAKAVEAPFVKGGIAGVQIYDVALSNDEVRALETRTLAAALPEPISEDRAKKLHAYFDNRLAIRIAREQEAFDTAQKSLDDLKNAIPSVMVMQERAEARPTYRLKRGAYDAPDMSEVLAPRTPGFLPAMAPGAPVNRMGLAEWVVNPANPLPARVAVNHLWQLIFGRGLVKTSEDFGVQGSPPSHPQLLDTLAVRFVESGWDVKKFLKEIVMSSTYRQSSVMNGAVLAADPENQYYARAPRFRMTAEMIRDNALAVSGLLAKKIGGPPTMPYQPPGLWEELAGGAGQGPYVQSTGEALYRRSLYTHRKRTVPHPTLAAFDAPTFEVCLVRRARTDTPLQALTLLNDTTYVEAARHLAQRMIADVDGDPAARLAYGFRLATGRHPTARELESLTRGYYDFAVDFATDQEAAAALVANGASAPPAEIPASVLAPYTTEAEVLLNLDEVITRR